MKGLETEEAIVEDLVACMTAADRDWMETHTLEETRGLHFTYGMWIRNNYGLWADHPLTERWRDVSRDHPDAVSDRIIQAVWRKVNGQ